MEKITFYYPYKEDIIAYEVEAEKRRFWSASIHGTPKAWLLLTYLRAKEKDYNVEISTYWPGTGIIILLSDAYSLNVLEKNYEEDENTTYVIIRADEIEFHHFLCDVEVLQNGRFANERDSFFIPHWPQPGLIPRKPERGNKIRNIVFYGGLGSLDPQFVTDSWYEALKERDIHFKLVTEKGANGYPVWYDYSDADLVLAVRPQFRGGGNRCDKPASKLVNAWHTGVPAILGAEYAFRELRKSELDYFEVNTVGEALQVIDRLQNEPSLYEAMVANGRKRAEEFTVEKITDRWVDVLLNKVPQIRQSRRFRMSRMLSSRLRKPFNLISRPQSAFEYRKALGHYYRNLKHR